LVPSVIRSVLRGEPPKITSGKHRIDWIFVEDVVSGFMKLAVAPRMDGKSVDLGSGSVITTKKMVDSICMLMKTEIQPAYGALPDRPLEPLRVADTKESLRLIDWAPSIQLAEGLCRTIDWYGRQRPGNDGFRDSGWDSGMRSNESHAN
jgi:UDP-glucose 4-epimerase